ncbi:tRNA selenocysteine 1-associated protein 1-like isoform X2 [Dreissena polymorpha]|uniref:tRNA selenocysteine 1-associated protein 1-like isoform X2 n=1 Tax=Dreissena polymorpha TaxID=45954 RepID=UPI002263B489|nr:tRNA selenocysteine 1-associated protein 1-like isoform X2 [Dreissena polymorpha]
MYNNPQANRHPGTMTTEPTKTLWMGDLEPYMDEQFVLQAFEQMGEPAKGVKLIINKVSGIGVDLKSCIGSQGTLIPKLPAGYCFVDFNDSESSLKAQLRLNGKIIPNSQPPHRFKLNSNNVKDAPRREFSLFVGDLSDEVDDFILYRAFVKKYPSCLTAKVVLDSKGQTKGYGFVRFAEETDQQKALIEMQHTVGIGRKPIRVSLATPKKRENDVATAVAAHTYNKAYQDYYQAYYQQYYSNYYNTTQPPVPVPQTVYANPEDDPNALEDPELDIDIDRYNQEYMAQSEEIFEMLEDSRWHPMDQWNSTVPTTARTGSDVNYMEHNEYTMEETSDIV